MSDPILSRRGALGAGANRPGMQATIKDIRQRCPQAELATIPRAGGTYCVIAEPEATAAAALAFLARHPIRRG